MATAFGPQSPNFVTVRPANSPDVSAGLDTWVKNCSAPGANDGTILDATFFNVIIGNLRTAVVSADVDLDANDDFMLEKAIRALAADEITAGDGLRKVGSTLSLSIGRGVLPVMTAA